MTRFLLLSLCLLVPAAYAEPPAEATQALNAGQYEQALTLLNQHLSRQPQDADARFQKGLALVMLKRDDEAIRVFSDLARDFPELPEPYNNLAVLYARAGQYEEARDALEAALVSHPSYATAHENLGDIYTALARAAYNRASVLDKNNAALQEKLEVLAQLAPQGETSGAPPAELNIQPRTPAATPQATPQPQIAQARPAPAATAAAPRATARPTPRPAAVDTGPRATPKLQPRPTPPGQTRPAPARESLLITGNQPVVGGAGGASTATATPKPAADRGAILEALQNWARAWSAQDVEAYLASYSPNFEPATGTSRAVWESQRRSRVVRPRSISVQVLNPDVFQGTPKFARVDFLQIYESDTYSDQVRKQIELEKLNGRWLIVSERVAN